MSIFYIADTHFGHESILKLCKRPFSNTAEMNEALVKNWNARVKGNDKVYILGDLFFKAESVKAILCRLKGEKHLILGNHDASWLEEYTVKPNQMAENIDTLPHKSYRLKETGEDLSLYFKSVNDILQITDGNVGCILCHYPLLTWKHEARLYMIHGHLHNDFKDSFFHHIAENEKIINAGVDINGFAPVTLEEMIENNRAYKERILGENGA